VVGSGDDHELDVIGWRRAGQAATTPRTVRSPTSSSIAAPASRGLAVALDLDEELHRLASVLPAALAIGARRHEASTALHFAVAAPSAMVALLLALGLVCADRPDGAIRSAYASTPSRIDRWPRRCALAARLTAGALALREWESRPAADDRRATPAARPAGRRAAPDGEARTPRRALAARSGHRSNARWHHWSE
jgi:hypothetical protein